MNFKMQSSLVALLTLIFLIGSECVPLNDLPPNNNNNGNVVIYDNHLSTQNIDGDFKVQELNEVKEDKLKELGRQGSSNGKDIPLAEAQYSYDKNKESSSRSSSDPISSVLTFIVVCGIIAILIGVCISCCCKKDNRGRVYRAPPQTTRALPVTAIPIAPHAQPYKPFTPQVGPYAYQTSAAPSNPNPNHFQSPQYWGQHQAGSTAQQPYPATSRPTTTAGNEIDQVEQFPYNPYYGRNEDLPPPYPGLS